MNRLIAFEGIDGTGKTTADYIQNKLGVEYGIRNKSKSA